MSCRSFLPFSFTGAEAGGLASPPCSAGCPEHCEEHGESLSVFCLDDLEPVCKQCAAVSHAGHRVYILTEAADDCKEELRTSLDGLKQRIINCEEVIQTCKHASTLNQAEARFAEERMKRDFETLHHFLRVEEAARLLALWKKQVEKKREAEERKDRMDQLIKSLEVKIQLIEKELDAGGDGVQFLEQCQDLQESTQACSSEPEEVHSSLIDVAEHLGNLRYAVWDKMRQTAPYTPVILDPRTAGQSLRVSPEFNRVHILEQSLDNPVPANPERFHPYSCILAREAFSSGVHCWDVEVGDTDNWTLGVAAQSLSRRTEFEACPEDGLWCVSLRDSEYRALTSPSQVLNLDSSPRLSRVRVRLDWEVGTLTFTDADAETHLFTFRHRFTERVYPYFESISSRGGFAVPAQAVDVSVASEYVSVGDAGTEQEVNTGDVSECGRLTAGKNSANCAPRDKKVRRKKTESSRTTSKNQLSNVKPSGKEKTKDNRAAVKKQSNKPRFSTSYHVSLNRALNIRASESDESSSHKPVENNHDDALVDFSCDK